MKTAVRVLESPLREGKHIEVTQELRLPDGMPDIGRVLMSWAQPVLKSKEWVRDELAVTGGLTVWTVYLPEDGSEVRSVDTWLPFQMKWEVDPEVPEGQMQVLPLVRFADSRGISARKLMLRCGITCHIHVLSPREEEIYSPEQVPEDVRLLKRTYPVRLLKEAGEKTFVQDEELSIPASGAGAEKLLSATLSPEIAEKKVIGNRIVFKGTGNLHLAYRCAEGNVHTADLELPFSQFAELDHAYGPNTSCEVLPVVTDLEVDLAEQGKLRVKDGIVAQYLIDERELIEVTEDAYSPLRQVALHQENLMLPSVLEDRAERLRASYTLQGQTGHAVDLQLLPDMPKVTGRDDLVRLTVPGMFQLLYEGEDGMLRSANGRWEASTELPKAENVEVYGIPFPNGRGSAMAESDRIEMDGPVHLALRSVARTEIPMVTGLELGELRDPDPARPSLILVRPDSEDLWSVAKRCGSTVEAIKSLNNLEGEPDPDRLLLVPIS